MRSDSRKPRAHSTDISIHSTPAGKKYLSIIRFELIRLYEIQHSLRQLSYFDVFGRLRLTLQLARVTLSIPMAIDQAMRDPAEGDLGAPSAHGAEAEGIRDTSVTEERSGDDSSSEDSSSDSDHHDTAGDSETEVSEDEEAPPNGHATPGSPSGEAPPASHSHHHRRHRKHAGRPTNGHQSNNATNAQRRGSRTSTSRPRSRGTGAEAEFGMATDEADSDDSDVQRKLEKQHRRERRAVRRARRKARRRGHLKEARGSNGDEDASSSHQRQSSNASQHDGKSNKQQLQSKHGLLGPAGRGLLKGVVTILETSEGWVPGARKNDHED